MRRAIPSLGYPTDQCDAAKLARRLCNVYEVRGMNVSRSRCTSISASAEVGGKSKLMVKLVVREKGLMVMDTCPCEFASPTPTDKHVVDGCHLHKSHDDLAEGRLLGLSRDSASVPVAPL